MSLDSSKPGTTLYVFVIGSYISGKALFEVRLDRPRAAILQQVSLHGSCILTLGMAVEIAAEATLQLKNAGKDELILSSITHSHVAIERRAVFGCSITAAIGSFELAEYSTGMGIQPLLALHIFEN